MNAVLYAFIAAVCAHEAGHLIAATLLGLQPRLRVTAKPVPHLAVAALPGSRRAVALSGPLASLIVADVGAIAGSTALVIAGLVTAAELLIPVLPFDGGHLR